MTSFRITVEITCEDFIGRTIKKKAEVLVLAVDETSACAKVEAEAAKIINCHSSNLKNTEVLKIEYIPALLVNYKLLVD